MCFKILPSTFSMRLIIFWNQPLARIIYCPYRIVLQLNKLPVSCFLLCFSSYSKGPRHGAPNPPVLLCPSLFKPTSSLPIILIVLFPWGFVLVLMSCIECSNRLFPLRYHQLTLFLLSCYYSVCVFTRIFKKRLYS